MKKRILAGFLALGLGLGSWVAADSAFGDAGDNQAKPGSPQTVGSGNVTGMPPTAQTFWAVVAADGTLVRSFRAESVTTSGTGNYIVKFKNNLRNCSYVATIGLPGASGTEVPGFITTVGAAVDVNSAFVTTDDISGASSNRGFHLVVAC